MPVILPHGTDIAAGHRVIENGSSQEDEIWEISRSAQRGEPRGLPVRPTW
ncbi:hypothetical protein [Saccharopolyspora taberi]